MRKPREMPKRGYYVLMNRFDRSKSPIGLVEVVFTTGVPGKGGHKYWRDSGDPEGAEWSTLLWSCVPKVKDCVDNAADLGTEDPWEGPHYVFYPTLPPGIPPIPGGEPVPAP